MYLGTWNIDDALTFTVTTHTASTSALTDADSPPAYRVYEDETGTAILTGSMALLDDANTTGHYSEQITLSAANGFEEGKTYSIYITATVDSVTGATTRTFQVEAAPVSAAAIRAEIDSNSTQLAAIVADTGELQTDLADGGRLDLLLDAALADTNELQTDLADGGRLDLLIDAILADTNELQTDDIPGAIAALNNISTTQVNAEMDTALAEYDAPTKSELDAAQAAILAKLLAYVQLLVRSDAAIATDNATELTAINANGGSGAGDYDNAAEALEALRDRGDAAWITATGFSTLSAAQVNAEVDTALADIHLDHLFAATYDPASPPGAADALLNEMVENDGGVSRFTTNALEQAPSGGGSFDAGAVWDELKAGHTVSGSFGEEVQAHALTSDLANTSITVLNAVSGDTITAYQNSTWSFPSVDVSGATLTDYENVVFKVARDGISDANAVLLLDSTTGILTIGGGDPVDETLGTLTIDDATNFTVLVAMSEIASGIGQAHQGKYKWWLKGIDTTSTPDTGTPLAEGEFILKPLGIEAQS